MSSEEEEDVAMVPDVDAIFLLVAGGAEGGAGPRSFREEGVVTQRAWGRKGEEKRGRQKYESRRDRISPSPSMSAGGTN